MEGSSVAPGLTPSLLFGLGLLLFVPCLLFYLIFKLAIARWDTQWLARKRQRYEDQFQTFAESFDLIAQRLSKLSRRLAIIFAGACGIFAIYAATVFALNVDSQVREWLGLLIGMLWILATPFLGLKLMSVSFHAAGVKIRNLLSTGPH